MLISQLSTYWQQIEDVSGRLEMTDILVELFKNADPAESQYITYLCLGRLGPRYDNTEFNLAAKSMLRVIAQWGSMPLEEVQDLYKQTGDIGDLIFSLIKQEKLPYRRHPELVSGSPSESANNIGDDSTQILKQVQDDPSPDLTVTSVYDSLLRIATLSGTGSQDQKVTQMVSLLSSLDPLSAKFIARLPIGKLRLGFSDMTILDALSFLIANDKGLRSDLENAYNVAADVGLLVRNVKTWLAADVPPSQIQTKLQSQQIVWGTPVVAALCQRLKTFDEIIEKMGTVAIEPKYDGTRVQIHLRKGNSKQKIANREEDPTISRHPELDSGSPFESANNSAIQPVLIDSEASSSSTSEERPTEILNQVQDDTVADSLLDTRYSLLEVKTFTRNLEENSAMFPELLQIADQINADSVVLDCEAVGYDPQTDEILPFQTTIQRKRKHGITEAATDIPLRFMIFDVLYTDEQGTVMDQPFSQRRALLKSLINDNQTIQVIELETTDDPEVLRQKHFKYLEAGLEGAIIKKWDSPYTPGRKGWHWVKMKHVETADAMLSDTIDGVVMGYYHGRGKRSQLGMGAFLIGITDSRHTFSNDQPTSSDHPKRSPELVERIDSGSPSEPSDNPTQILKQVQDDLVSQNDASSEASSTSKLRNFETSKPETSFLTVSKIGTGMTEDQITELVKLFKPHIATSKPAEYTVSKELTPDVWLQPSIVVEVAADEITESKMHTSGYGLRFPRLLKIRDDKDATQATSIDELKSIK